MFKKYFKPRSVTWWSSVVPLVIGLIIAVDPLHPWGAITTTMTNLTDIPSYMLINGGLFGIGLRGAL